jgi:hypothetical protein
LVLGTVTTVVAVPVAAPVELSMAVQVMVYVPPFDAPGVPDREAVTTGSDADTPPAGTSHDAGGLTVDVTVTF